MNRVSRNRPINRLNVKKAGVQRARSISAASAPRVLLCLCQCLCLYWGLILSNPSVAASRDSAPNSAKSRESELRQVRERINSVAKAIQADAERRDALVGQLRQADESIQTARGRLAEVRARRVQAEQQLQDLRQEQATAQAKLQLERTALAQELKLTYINGRNEQLKLLLNQQDPAQLGRMLNYYGYFGRARAEHIGAINDQLAHLELLAGQIQAEADKLRSIEDEHEQGARALAQARQRRASTLAQVETKLKTGNQRLTKLKADAAGLERLVAELRKAMEKAAQSQAKTGGRAPTGRGSWPWPIKGEVLARFGQLRAGGPLRWEGLMIGASPGTQVRAPAAGQVLYADWLPGLGLLLALDHGGGIMSLYGHNEQLFRKVGERVTAGEVLGAVGETGLNDRSGVYLEIRNGKQPVDPLNWLGKP